ncbi:MarR family winged helix-turn-helix transcriptional regulator [Lacticaseibacillus zhaodongensis]|uniref:MarR family winged helix-turn-helix transcriptional regulator n=1 Tax=Lacticaseibacillus zhaodongensis TaxID=2668065 RepID=UPI0012D2BE10|nr:MarR family transcriptional regulator [Lacticaseibacillus zhaodongensis]
MEDKELMSSFTDVYFKTMKDMTTILQAATAPYKVSFEQYQIMRDVAHKNATSLTELVKLRGVTKPAIARQLRTLRSLNYMRQKVADEDRRRHVLSLTRSGQQVEKQIETNMDGRLSTLLLALGPDDIQTLKQLLTQLDVKVLEPVRATQKSAQDSE